MTPEQRAAAEYLWKPNSQPTLQLVAGAGSGKTYTLIHTLLAARKAGVDPATIALITFTRKAAAEMTERMERAAAQLPPAEAPLKSPPTNPPTNPPKEKITLAGFVGTMHSLAYSLILQHERTSRGGRLTPSSPHKKLIAHSEPLRKRLAWELFPSKRHIPAGVLIKILDPQRRGQLEEAYRQYKADNNQIDLDDLIEHAALLLESRRLAPPFDCLLVDEFQDTSPDQIRFIKALRPKKLFAVGDDWQSIYRFRGADTRISIDFPSHFPGAKRMFLTRNFRSSKGIVNFGNRAIRLSQTYIKKKLKAAAPIQNKKPRCYIITRAVPPETAWKMLSPPLEKLWPNREFCVLVRTNQIRHKLEPLLPQSASVMTIHASKGLEFDRVLVFGVAKSVFPHRWNIFDEEVRLLYVAATRAKRELAFLTWEEDQRFSEFMPFLARNCRLSYLDDFPEASGHDQGPTG